MGKGDKEGTKGPPGGETKGGRKRKRKRKRKAAGGGGEGEGEQGDVLVEYVKGVVHGKGGEGERRGGRGGGAAEEEGEKREMAWLDSFLVEYGEAVRYSVEKEELVVLPCRLQGQDHNNRAEHGPPNALVERANRVQEVIKHKVNTVLYPNSSNAATVSAPGDSVYARLRLPSQVQYNNRLLNWFRPYVRLLVREMFACAQDSSQAHCVQQTALFADTLLALLTCVHVEQHDLGKGVGKKGNNAGPSHVTAIHHKKQQQSYDCPGTRCEHLLASWGIREVVARRVVSDLWRNLCFAAAEVKELPQATPSSRHRHHKYSTRSKDVALSSSKEILPIPTLTGANCGVAFIEEMWHSKSYQDIYNTMSNYRQ
eukprot:Nk52_evm8s2542 gene=Nk52_evmTU8s2542